MDDSVMMCDEVIEKTVPTNFNEKKATFKMQNFYNYYNFKITAALIAEQKYLLPFHNTDNGLKQKRSLSFHDTNNGLKQVIY